MEMDAGISAWHVVVAACSDAPRASSAIESYIAESTELDCPPSSWPNIEHLSVPPRVSVNGLRLLSRLTSFTAPAFSQQPSVARYGGGWVRSSSTFLATNHPSSRSRLVVSDASQLDL